MVQKDKLVKVPQGKENAGVTPQQKETAKKTGLELAKTLGIDTPIEELTAGCRRRPNRYTLSIVLALMLVRGTAMAEDDWVPGTRYDGNNPAHVAAAKYFGEPVRTDQVGVDMGEGLRVYKNQAAADAYIKERDVVLKAQYQAKAEHGEGVIRYNGEILQPQSQGTPEVSGAARPAGGTALLPTPKTLNGETVGLSGFANASTVPTQGGMPDGYVVVNGVLAKDSTVQEKAIAPKEEWPTDRIEKARQINAEGLAKFRDQVKTEGRELTTDELRLAACRLDIQNRVYSNPSINKPTPEEIEKEALKQVEEWKRDNMYMLPDGNVASFGPGGIARWVQSEREFREKFLQETHATAERISKGVVQGLTAEQHAWEEKARLGTLKTQTELEISMREESEKKIAQMLKDTGVSDPGVSHSTASKSAPVAYVLQKTLVSYEKVSDKK